MLESNSRGIASRKLIQTMSGGVGRRAGASIGWKDFPYTWENSYGKLPRSVSFSNRAGST